MNKPNKPKQPVAPCERIVLDRLKVPIFTRCTPQTLLDYGLNNYRRNTAYKDLVITGNFIISEFERGHSYTHDDFSEKYAIFTGGELSFTNPRYNEELIRYNKDVANFPRRLAKYEDDQKLYSKWVIESKYKEEEEKIAMLREQIKEAELAIEKLNDKL